MWKTLFLKRRKLIINTWLQYVVNFGPFPEFSALVCLVKILVVPPLQWAELYKVSAPSQLAHVTCVHVTGSRKSWNSWLTEVCGNHKNIVWIPAKSGKRARIYSWLVSQCLFCSEKLPEPSNHYQNFHELFFFFIMGKKQLALASSAV